MSDKKGPQEPNLDFEQAKKMTIEEAVDKNKDLQAGITDQDSVLDRYIKQHRDEVGSQKFVQRLSEMDEIDTSTLDAFIKRQREELEKTGFLDKLSNQEEVPSPEAVPVEPHPVEVVEVKDEQLDMIPVLPLNFSDEEDEDRIYTGKERLATESGSSKKKGLLAAALLLLGIPAIGFGWNHIRNNSQNQANSVETTTTTEVTTTTAAKTVSEEDQTVFDNLYASFFADEDKTKLKNSEFAKLADLEKLLAKFEGTDAYDDAKSKYDGLARQIKAIQDLNAQFESEVIKDGEVLAAKVKAGANFDSLSSDVLNTGNAKLDSLIQSAISDGRSQLTSGTTAGAVSGASNATAETSSSETGATVPGVQDTSAAVDANATDAKAAAAPVYGSGYGITSYDPAILQRDLSRLAYNEAQLADVNNPAWAFNAGILENIVSIANQRGHISGYNFILERVAIVNGNGYYNMFKPDGTYLFTINAKTGYFVGNAPGRADSLDF